jgi:Ino eighty subunit 1
MLKGAQGQNGRDTCLRSRIGQDLLIDKRGTHQHNNGMYALVPLIVHGYLIVLTKLPVFPEMKTALRTYHPVPSLQKTDGNAQDAPRIKNCLKAALLPSELKLMPPSTPEEILEKSRARELPPTSVVNLIFVLANHAAPLAATHFDPPLNFLDLFLPINISSADRARAFLWLVYHYLEGPDQPNPYDDDYSRQNPGKVPWLRRLTDAELAEENVDTAEEMEWGRAMSAQRNVFLQRLVNSLESEKKAKNAISASSQRVSESSSHRSRPSRQPHDGAREKPYIHYMPPPRPAPAQQPTERPAGSGSRGPQRTMFQHAWHVVTSTDPLVDSDEELDEYVRNDYNQRIAVIARLRGRAPTPPPDIVVPPNNVSDTREHRWRTVQSWR